MLKRVCQVWTKADRRRRNRRTGQRRHTKERQERFRSGRYVAHLLQTTLLSCLNDYLQVLFLLDNTRPHIPRQ